MRSISRRRRHPAARPIILIVALFLMGGLYAIGSPTKVAAEGETSTQVAEGKKLFQVSCSSCHGLNGEGGSQGPSLVGVGAASVDFQMSTNRMPMSNPGAQAPRKSRTIFTPEDITKIAAYVDSLGTGPGIPNESQYSAEGLDEEALARGGELFRTNCSACHNFAGKGGALPNGKYAPTLVGVENKHIWEALRTGPQQMPVFSQEALSDQDVREIIGYLNELHSQPNQGGSALGGLGPVSEGFWAWVLGLGSCVAFATWLAARGARAR